VPNNEWGDFQTPAILAEQVLDALPERPWARVLEPTCGEGSFLSAASRFVEAERVGIEVQRNYVDKAVTTGARIIAQNVFDLHLGSAIDWSSTGELLVVGNPPWVTNAELGAKGSINLPNKSNIRRLKGIDALTGASNFDIAESIFLKAIVELADDCPTIALLCKTQVARNVLGYCHRVGIPLSGSFIRRVDAKKWFGASVDACLFVTAVTEGPADWVVPVYPTLESVEPERRLGFAGGRLVADFDAHARSSFIDGSSPLEWRQGVKHDASAVMELRELAPGRYESRGGEVVEVEPDWVFPLLKATDIHHGRAPRDRVVIVTQRSLSDDTALLADQAPMLWSYLQSHAGALDGRKSSIYHGRPRFSMFGIGPYTLTPWKVAVSGLHAAANFQLVGPLAQRPVVLDDTCYLLPFAEGRSAAIVAALLLSAPVKDLLSSLLFSDSKRPVTKKLLQRINLAAVADAVALEETASVASELLREHVSTEDVECFRDREFACGQLNLSA
jgi:hypothetical protein